MVISFEEKDRVAIEEAWNAVLDELKKHGSFYDNLYKEMFEAIDTPDMMADADPEYIVKAIFDRILLE
ncbi:MAG: hypothetical protein K2N73_10305 [Lachnospiraceae bacterium]|nr:hypothetical protein [Lachnospiraceae bacterium]